MINLNKKEKACSAKLQRSRGFTLIELLVVISIISLLSVIVIASVQDARDKANNTKLNEIARQYINAFALLTTDGTTDYPTASFVCLGYYESEDQCYTGVNGSLAVDDALDDYFPDMPKNDDFEVQGWSGVQYYNYGTPTITWYLSGNEDCISDATPSPYPTSSTDPDTRCTYPLK